ncbi:MAG: ABC transporter substrate-binding protein [Erysipelotrichaceae bacterium]|jgi:spermidine/putrescine-binding protein|nr:ABC transporter substrate-binding protein [Erysipelotrichaceae bacterium]
MKKILLIGVLLLSLLAGCGSSSGEKQTLKIFSPSVYIDPSVITEFEQKFNAKVIFDEFESNEQMYTKLLSGETYDILVPSDYMIERLIEEGKLQEIDLDKIPNFSGVIEGITNLDYDPGNKYSVPYFWGTVGLLYNENNVDLADLKAEGWNILHDTKYKGKIFIYDSERDMFMVALKALGYSANTDDEAEIQAAYEWLVQINSTMDPVYVTDEVIDAMIAGNKDLAIIYSGDAVYIKLENEAMEYFTPSEGTNLWVDAMVIPADAANPDLAHEWINFMLDEDVAYRNTIEVGYTSILQSVYDEVSGPGGDFEGIEAYIPRLGYAADEIFHHNEELRKAIAELWVRVKAQ